MAKARKESAKPVNIANCDHILTDLIHQIIDLDPDTRLNALYKTLLRKRFSAIDLGEIEECFEKHKQKVYNGIEEP